jgi:hypothetical protein
MVVGWYIGYTSAIHRVAKRVAKQHQENTTSTFNLYVLVSLESHLWRCYVIDSAFDGV